MVPVLLLSVVCASLCLARPRHVLALCWWWPAPWWHVLINTRHRILALFRTQHSCVCRNQGDIPASPSRHPTPRPGMPLPVNNIFVGSRDHWQLCELDQPRIGDRGQQGPSFWRLLQLKASCVGVRWQERVTTMVIAFPLTAFLTATLSITLPSFRLLVQPTKASNYEYESIWRKLLSVSVSVRRYVIVSMLVDSWYYEFT